MDKVPKLRNPLFVAVWPMASAMHAEHESRVFGAAIDQDSLAKLKVQELEILEDGQISELNGVLLGAAAEAGMRGACLLGEMPHIFARLPFPRASLAVLAAFEKLADGAVDLTALSQQAAAVDQQLGELLEKVQRMQEAEEAGDEERPFQPEPAEEGRLSPEDKRRIEQLLNLAREDRSKAYELKRELDRLEVCKEYEDRFLDLFKAAD